MAEILSENELARIEEHKKRAKKRVWMMAAVLMTVVVGVGYRTLIYRPKKTVPKPVSTGYFDPKLLGKPAVMMPKK